MDDGTAVDCTVDDVAVAVAIVVVVVSVDVAVAVSVVVVASVVIAVAVVVSVDVAVVDGNVVVSVTSCVSQIPVCGSHPPSVHSHVLLHVFVPNMLKGQPAT